jgi:predicted TIM-barrel fold metal-dependent hydrolase
LDVTLEAGDVLFIPAAFPHTTDTVSELENTPENTSIHLTFNFDTHIWDLNYLSARRLVLMRADVVDTALGQSQDDNSKYVGTVNSLPKELHSDLFSNLPLDFCDDMKDLPRALDEAVTELKRISKLVDANTFEAIPSEIWNETVERLQKHGLELFDIHRDMYLAAIEEGRQRKMEEIILNDVNSQSKTMTPEKMQRLSLFRVQKYFERITEAKKSLHQWSIENVVPSSDAESKNSLPPDWAFTLPLKVGDKVEADLGGAFFPATVTKIGTSYDVKFFDGDSANGLSRDMIKLLAPPTSALSNNSNTSNEPPPGLTKKELKKWMKKQEKSKSKEGFKLCL